MKQKQLDRLKQLDKEIEKVLEECDKKRKLFEAEEESILDKCDHVFPNGKTAVKNWILACQCEICGWLDFEKRNQRSSYGSGEVIPQYRIREI